MSSVELQSLIGKTEAEAKEFLTGKGLNNIRVRKPGGIYTMDHRMDRVNLVMDLDGKVKSIHFG